MNQMAKKKLTKSQQLKKQNKRAARKRKKQRLVMVAQKKIEAKQKLLEADKKAVIEFSELIIAEMLKDKCLKIVEQEDGGLNTSGDFIELMFSYINKSDTDNAIKEKAIDLIAERLEKIHFDMVMDYLPDAKEVADTVIKRFKSGERSNELREFVRKHCEAGEYFEWEDSFWDITEKQGFTMDDYEALPGGIA